ncbi:MAG: universal stress protein [Dehalococcoidia bacterium]
MRILVAIDRGPVSEEVAAAVAHLTTAADEVHVLTVVHPKEVSETVPHTGGLTRSVPMRVPTGTGGLINTEMAFRMPAEDGSQAVLRVKAAHAAYLHDLAARLLPDVESHVHVEVDEHPATAILKCIVDLEAHGVALGTRDRGTVRRALLGSVAEEVMRKAPVPVLIVREGITVPRAETEGAVTEGAEPADMATTAS